MDIVAQARDCSIFVMRNDGAADHVETANTLTTCADEIERLRAENRRLHDTKRWNIKEEGGDLLICTGAHEKHEPCVFYRYARDQQSTAGSR